MARLPIRFLGLMLLAVALSVASCQALLHGLTEPATATVEPGLDRHD